MKSILNKACISVLFCGSVLVAIPALAAGAGGTSTGTGVNTKMAQADNADATTKASNSDTNAAADANASADAAANGVKTAAKAPAHHMSKKSQRSSNAAEVETTRQLNQEAAANAKATPQQ